MTGEVVKCAKCKNEVTEENRWASPDGWICDECFHAYSMEPFTADRDCAKCVCDDCDGYDTDGVTNVAPTCPNYREGE